MSGPFMSERTEAADQLGAKKKFHGNKFFSLFIFFIVLSLIFKEGGWVSLSSDLVKYNIFFQTIS